MADPLYQSARCPRCRKVKVARYRTFKHCKKIWKTDDHLVNDELAESKAPRGVAQGADKLEVSW